jgi:hypothetical protein
MAVIQYTVTHKEYTEQHNETEYTQCHMTIRMHKHNNKSMQFTQLNRSIQNIKHIYIYIYMHTNTLLFRRIYVYCVNYMEHVNMLLRRKCIVLNVKSHISYSSQCTFGS